VYITRTGPFLPTTTFSVLKQALFVYGLLPRLGDLLEDDDHAKPGGGGGEFSTALERILPAIRSPTGTVASGPAASV